MKELRELVAAATAALAAVYEHRRRHAPTTEWHNRRTELDNYFIDRADEALSKIPLLFDEVARLRGLINTPRTDEFFEAVRIEAAHQIERWGVEHDAGKRPEDWFTLLGYLGGKAIKAYYDGDAEKLKHHIVTIGAVCLNWLRNLNGETTAMRPGVAPDHPLADGAK